jgi:hypothetical protein
MFLDHRKTNGNNNTSETIMEIKATFMEEPNIRYEIIKAAIPIATFNP